jgi:Calcineurin-like phosphoesterase
MPVSPDHRRVREDRSTPPTPATTTHHPPSPPAPATQWPMVGWYQPSQLIRTGIAVAISTIFGRHSDHRLVEAISTNGLEFYDYTCHYDEDDQGRCEPDPSRPRQELWIDYVGDVGDGWHSTYAMASSLARPRLHITRDIHGRTCDVHTERGNLLIFGGDEVYPTASREAYEQRLLGPYETALRETTAPPYPHVFAIPGNHDWYDSLASFIRLFTSRRWFGGWRTRQHRSYFALRLPQRWWLLGTDVQLGSDIDRPQVQYFEQVATQITQLDPGARIILCHAEPHSGAAPLEAPWGDRWARARPR